MKDTIRYIREELKNHLDDTDSTEHTVVAVYLFGFRAVAWDGKENSDLDLAFLLYPKAYDSDPVAAVAPSYLAATSLGTALDIETDVTILNAASLEIAYEVLTTGVCLLDNDPNKRMDYEIALRGMYFDFKPFLEELRSNCLTNL
jgi:uncharacterized protein